MRRRLFPVALVWLCAVGCRTNSHVMVISAATAPANTPPISKPCLMYVDANDPTRSVMQGSDCFIGFKVCNKEAAPLLATVTMRNDPADVNGAGMVDKTRQVTGFTAPQGTYCWMGSASVKRQRKKPVFVTVDWTRGGKKKTQQYTITPEMDNREQSNL